MFVDLEVQVEMPAAVVAPADAVIDSGRGKTVFVERGSGVFEPVPVETGWRLGDRIEITKGLEPGERIVVSGNFLIDSESRMKPEAARSPKAMADPAVSSGRGMGQ
jgi:multidrug efflux pump subunit AcrA (membrane-fusion protein)